jgi:hypothetical protein
MVVAPATRIADNSDQIFNGCDRESEVPSHSMITYYDRARPGPGTIYSSL